MKKFKFFIILACFVSLLFIFMPMVFDKKDQENKEFFHQLNVYLKGYIKEVDTIERGTVLLHIDVTETNNKFLDYRKSKREHIIVIQDSIAEFYFCCYDLVQKGDYIIIKNDSVFLKRNNEEVYKSGVQTIQGSVINDIINHSKIPIKMDEVQSKR